MKRMVIAIAALLALTGCGGVGSASDRLPDATLPCLQGGCSVALGSLRGPMVINVWATYCAPCRAEIPHIEAFSKKYSGRVRVLGVDYTDTLPQSELVQYIKSEGVTYEMVADTKPVIQTAVLPMTMLIDKTGKIVYKQAVALGSEAQLEQLVQQYLGVRG